MFLKPLTRAPRWILIQSFFLAIGWRYPHGLSHRFLRRLKLLWGETASQKRFFSTDNGRKSSLTIFTAFLTIQTSSQNISITLLKILLKSHEHRGCYCWKKLPWTILENSSQCREILLQVKEVMASFRCYDNCDVIETLIILLLTPGNFSKSLFIATEFILERRRYWPCAESQLQ